jgi:hypothetical protein
MGQETIHVLGKVDYCEFRYRRWDVWAGLALTLVGMVAGLWLWLRSSMANAGEPIVESG